MTEGRLILPGDFRPSRWRNGQGVSHDIATEPQSAAWDDLLFRLSVAEIEGDCDFSLFPGLDRSFVAFEGGQITLEPEDGAAVIAGEARRVLAFPGEWRIRCRLRGGPARAFNVFTRRGGMHHAVHLLGRSERIRDGAAAFVFAFDHGCRVGGDALPKGACLALGESPDIDYCADADNAAALITIERETTA